MCSIPPCIITTVQTNRRIMHIMDSTMLNLPARHITDIDSPLLLLFEEMSDQLGPFLTGKTLRDDILAKELRMAFLAHRDIASITRVVNIVPVVPFFTGRALEPRLGVTVSNLDVSALMGWISVVFSVKKHFIAHALNTVGRMSVFN